MSFKSRFLNILFWSVISAAFIGPGTVTTAAKAGADFGLSLLWTLTFSTIACLVLQEAASRITIASGTNLGQAIAKKSAALKGGLGISILVGGSILVGTAAYQTGNLLGAMSGAQLVCEINPKVYVLIIGILAGLILYIPSLQIIARIMGSLVAIMGLAFLLTAISTGPSAYNLIRGLIVPVVPLNQGGGLLILGLIGTTVVPYNLFLGSGITKEKQNIREMRFGLSIAIVLGGIISMAVLITGTSVMEEFTFLSLSNALNKITGGWGRYVLGFGLFAAGFTSAVTAPLASAITVKSLFGNKNPEKWGTSSSNFRLVWFIILLIGITLGFVNLEPIPAIITAQALNGLILPVISIFLLFAVNDKVLLGSKYINTTGSNILMILVVFITLIIGLMNLSKAIIDGLNIPFQRWFLCFLIDFLLSGIIISMIVIRIFNLRKRKTFHHDQSFL